MENNTQYIQENTIDLRELFSVLKKRKKLIGTVSTLFTLVALVYVLITKPVYEVNAMIEIGQIDSKPIDNIEDVKQKLSYEYQVDTKKKTIELPRIKSISVPRKSNSILSIDIYGYSNEEAKQYIQNVIKKIETEYKEKTNAYINSKKTLIQLIQDNIKENSINLGEMKKEIETYTQKIISLKSEDAILAGIYTLHIGQKQTELHNLQKYISELKNKKQEIELSITPLMMKPTHIVGAIETRETPIKPNKALILIVSFITGLIFSVFLAFFLEFINEGPKKEEETQA